MSNFSLCLTLKNNHIMGIKSFQGARKVTQQNKNNNQENFKVSDFMTRDLITFKSTQSVEEVVNILIKHRISGGPVVNENNAIEKYMARNVETIDGNLNVFDAAKQFLDSKRRRFPIVEDGKLVGQISQKDILKAAMQLKQQNWK